MSFSEAQRLTSVELSKLRNLMAEAPAESINLALGELAFPFPEALSEHVIKLMKDARPAYTPNAGTPELRAKLGERYHASAENICVCNGAEEALYISLQALLNPGDIIAIPDPDYPAYPVLAHLAGAEVSRLPFGDDLTSIDWELWEMRLQSAKILLMSHPSNPTGFCFDDSSFSKLCNIVNKHDIILIVDEIYSDVYINRPYQPDYHKVKHCIRINGLSKSHLMSGWRIGWIFADPDVILAATKLKQYISTCPVWISQKLALFALDQENIPTMIQENLRQNQSLAVRMLDSSILHVPSCTPYLMIKAPQAIAQVKNYMAQGVITMPGSAFGSLTVDWIRINYAIEYELLRKALKRIQ
jgi:aspartate/methionine/tyrosine aminotransferase